jgi:hypothetical protein
MGVCLTYDGGIYVILILGILMIFCGIGIAISCDTHDQKRKEDKPCEQKNS